MRIAGIVVLIAAVLLVTPVFSLAQDPVSDWRSFETAVRDRAIPRPEAEQYLAPLMARLSSYALSSSTFSAGSWAFPLQGYTVKAMEKRDFKPMIVYGPYRTKGYDFFDGNRHGGHPAYDIFIRDKNEDSCDDRTGKPVNAVAMTDAVVLSINTGWTKDSKIRGGNYVWLYNPAESKLFYYAHLDKVFVKSDEFVPKAGLIGTVGRTGVLAAKKTSPTHTHLMVLEYRDGKFYPYNYYPKLNTGGR